MMRDATATEYQEAANQARDKRIIEGARCQDIYWTTCGVLLAHQTRIFKHGKVIQNHYSVRKEEA
jgi:hypothetical protein